MTAIDLVFTGDLVLDEPNPDHWLSGITPALHRADAVIGHLEVPHSARGTELAGDVPAPGADPAHLAAIQRAGFDALSLAGNHIADLGADGINDTCEGLRRLGLQFTGAGANLDAASAPAFLDVGGRRLVLLSFNCVGPEGAWATPERAGCAYVRVETGTAHRSPPLHRSNAPTNNRSPRCRPRSHACGARRIWSSSPCTRASSIRLRVLRPTSDRSHTLRSTPARTSSSRITPTSCAASNLIEASRSSTDSVTAAWSHAH